MSTPSCCAKPEADDRIDRRAGARCLRVPAPSFLRLRPALCGLLLSALIPAGPLAAQQPPYDQAPAVAPPYYRVRHEASATPGELVYPVTWTLWLPPGQATLRGLIVHQHGCGEGSCKSGQTGAFDLHWQALAKKHGCALLAPSYEQPDKANCQLWCDPRNGSDRAFQKALAELGAQCGHPELARVPWALWGHSGGGHWAGGMVLLHPQRVAAAWLRSGVPPVQAAEGKPAPYAISEAACGVPVLCNLGTKEGVTVKEGRFAGVWAGVETFFKALRGRGGLAAVAVDPLSSHDCGNQRYLAIPWLDACLSARLPAQPGEALRPMPVAEARLAPLAAGAAAVAEPVPAAQFTGAQATSVWLPNAAIARAWAEYSRDSAVTDTTPPPAPTGLRVQGRELTWAAEADLESGLAGFIIERDGREIARLPEQPKNPFGRPIFQGLQYSDTPTVPLVGLRYTDAGAEPGRTHRYRVIAVNTVGLRSE